MMALLGFIAGISTIGFEPVLSTIVPVWLWLFSLLLTLISVALLSHTQIRHFLIARPYACFAVHGAALVMAFIFGSGYYAHWQLQQALQQRLSQPLEQTAIVRVMGISDGVGEQWRQVVETVALDPKLNSIKQQPATQPVKWLLYGAYDWNQQQPVVPPAMQPGQLWQVSVKLKPAHSQASPGAFDVEKWLLQQHIGATGTIQTAQRLTPQQIQHLQLSPDSLLQQLNNCVQQERLRIREHFIQLKATNDSAARGVLLGLLTGDRSLIDADTTLLYH